MYTHVYEEMEDVGIAEKLYVPMWQTDGGGGRLCGEDAFECNVTHRSPYPFVMDEVGGNTSQKGDGHIEVSC